MSTTKKAKYTPCTTKVSVKNVLFNLYKIGLMNGIGFEGLMLNNYYLVQHRLSCDQKRLDEKGLDGLRFKRGSGYSYFT